MLARACVCVCVCIHAETPGNKESKRAEGPWPFWASNKSKNIELKWLRSPEKNSPKKRLTKKASAVVGMQLLFNYCKESKYDISVQLCVHNMGRSVPCLFMSGKLHLAAHTEFASCYHIGSLDRILLPVTELSIETGKGLALSLLPMYLYAFFFTSSRYNMTSHKCVWIGLDVVIHVFSGNHSISQPNRSLLLGVLHFWTDARILSPIFCLLYLRVSQVSLIPPPDLPRLLKMIYLGEMRIIYFISTWNSWKL